MSELGDYKGVGVERVTPGARNRTSGKAARAHGFNNRHITNEIGEITPTELEGSYSRQMSSVV